MQSSHSSLLPTSILTHYSAQDHVGGTVSHAFNTFLLTPTIKSHRRYSLHVQPHHQMNSALSFMHHSITSRLARPAAVQHTISSLSDYPEAATGSRSCTTALSIFFSQRQHGAGEKGERSLAGALAREVRFEAGLDPPVWVDGWESGSWVGS